MGHGKNEDRARLIAKGAASVYVNSKSGRIHLLTLGPGHILDLIHKREKKPEHMGSSHLTQRS